MNSHNIKISLLVTAIFFGIFPGCDNLDEDQLPAADIKDFDSESFLTSGSMAIIDVSEGIESNQPVTLLIATPPHSGRLESLQGGLLKYLPDETFLGGKDFFDVEIKSDKNELLAVKTVRITVDPDSADLPCTLIAFSDFASTKMNDSVIIDVLQNDWDCEEIPIDTASLALIHQPLNGEAIIVGSNIQYMPNSSFLGVDEFVYSIGSIDKGIISHALVQVFVSADSAFDCFTHLADDSVFLGQGADRILIKALDNDSLCDSAIVSVEIAAQPQYGEARVIEDDSAGRVLEYRLIREIAGGTDQFTYQVCDSFACYEATVTVTLWSCTLRANDDYFVLNTDSSFQNGDYELAILQNDEYCMTDSLHLRIIYGPSSGAAVIDDRMLLYSVDSVGHYADSLVYEICQGTQGCDSANVFIDFQ